jgi:hypothetical protein
MAEFVELMKTALFSGDNNVRPQAEQKLLELRKLNPAEFYTNLVNILANESNPSAIRQGAGTILRRTLIMPV